MTVVEFQSVLTCPHCGHARRETMPSDAWVRANARVVAVKRHMASR
jgi:hypothetical protein